MPKTTTKKRRIPLSESGQQRLQAPDGLDFTKFNYRWVNNAPGRIEAAQAGGYQLVSEEDVKTVGADVGSSVSKVNNQATGQRSHLMRLPIALYKEDQEAKELANRAVDESINRQEFKGRKLEGAYVPEGGGIKGFNRN